MGVRQNKVRGCGRIGYVGGLMNILLVSERNRLNPKLTPLDVNYVEEIHCCQKSTMGVRLDNLARSGLLIWTFPYCGAGWKYVIIYLSGAGRYWTL